MQPLVFLASVKSTALSISRLRKSRDASVSSVLDWLSALRIASRSICLRRCSLMTSLAANTSIGSADSGGSPAGRWRHYGERSYREEIAR